MQVTFFGVRGSTPCHGDSIARYGGNTSCVAVHVPGGEPLFFDLGTGVRYLGAQQPHDGSFRGTCLLSHMHWDHTQGLPFFTPLHHAGSQLDIYGPQQDDGRRVADVINAAIRPPLFPVTVAELPGTVRFHDTGDSEFHVGEVKVIARMVPHIGPTLGYRLEWRGLSVAYLSDHQQPHDGSFAISEGAREIAQGADLLIHDSQYTNHEFAAKATWGHCTIDFAVWLAEECKVRRLALFHHDPTRTDDALDELRACAIKAGRLRGVEVFAASEGLTVDVA
ncbi:MAG: MBL fold metallo-hydrolase [Actinomycetota bacterium]|nr:MBL fold metallo-hydrolase [Actinomycetota bacterium]